MPEARKTDPYSRARRPRTVVRGWRIRRSAPVTIAASGTAGSADPVARPGDRLDDRGVAELGPQPAHCRLHRLAERVGRLVPDPLQELLAGDDGAAGAEQDLQHGELLRVEREFPARPGDLPTGGVQPQVPVAQHRGKCGTGAPYQRPDPGHQFAEVEGLGQVVVGAQAEALDAVADGAGPGEHEDPG